MRERIAEQWICINQGLFKLIAKLFQPRAINTHHKTINNHWTIVPDQMNTITTPITATYTVSSRVSRVLHQTGCKTKLWCLKTIENPLSLPKISNDSFKSDPWKWHQWFSFFKATFTTTDASDTECAFNASAAPSPNLLRKQYPFSKRARKQQFASRNNQETNNADSSD